VKVERLHRLQGVIGRHQTSFNSSCVGKVMPVLFERMGRHGGQLIGRSPYLQSVHAQADLSLLGHVLKVEISAAGPNSLTGQLTAAAAA
jgi:tRNA-2-methylthio-N6-dimethylallyladenosine synthase